eukprot:gene2180-1348_t
MEYEQLEFGSKNILRSIKTQDVGSFAEILSPDVLLVTHFPNPGLGSGSTDLIDNFRNRVNPKLQLKRLLAEQEQMAKAQQQRYREHLARMGDDGMLPGAAGDASGTSGAAGGGGGGDGAPPGGGDWDGSDADEGNPGRSSPRKNPKLEKASLVVNAMLKKVRQSGGPLKEPLGVTVYFQSQTEECAPYISNAADYHEHIDVSVGPLLVTGRFFELLSWMARGQHIAETRIALKPRKGILQDNEVLPPPPAPRNLRERFAMMGRQYTDRNQLLSRLTVTWGKDTLLFHDLYYFLEGYVVTIHRHMVPFHEMLERPLAEYPNASATHQAEILREEVFKFYGKSSTRVDTNNKFFPLLDFSFLPLQDAVGMLQQKPSSGQKHRAKEPRPEVDPRLAKGVFLTTENDPTKKKKINRTLIKAKNKKGDEEAYEFEAGQRIGFLDENENRGDTIESLIESCDKYDATAVRVSSCHLRDKVDKLPVILRGLVANAFVTIHSLDLSDNDITILPNFTSLPLQKLLLHGNKIADWEEIERNVCPLPFTVAVSLHGNPIEEHNPQYWPFALYRLISNPNRMVRLRQLDFVTLSAQDYNVAGSFEMFTVKTTSILEAQREYMKGGKGVVKGKKAVGVAADPGTPIMSPKKERKEGEFPPIRRRRKKDERWEWGLEEEGADMRPTSLSHAFPI